MNRDLSNIRTSYEKYAIKEDELEANGIIQFQKWLDMAKAEDVPEYNAMTLATMGLDGFPKARIVLLKQMLEGNLLFFTNYDSDKGHEMAANNKVSVNFFWLPQERQVRIEGLVSKTSTKISDDYFATRPLDSQLGAITSNQSKIVDSRDTMLQAYQANEKKWDGKTIVRPAHWGGYQIVPSKIEFWQGRKGRFHDRILYTLNNNEWNWVRLQP